MSLGEGVTSVCIWFGAPIMHMISGLNLAWHWYWHWHVVCVHMHLRSHSKIVCSGGVLFRWSASVNVKNRVFMWACSIWVMRCIALLCCAILRPFKYGCLHVDSRWGNVSLSLH
jgi:hypothetical protein